MESPKDKKAKMNPEFTNNDKKNLFSVEGKSWFLWKKWIRIKNKINEIIEKTKVRVLKLQSSLVA